MQFVRADDGDFTTPIRGILAGELFEDPKAPGAIWIKLRDMDADSFQGVVLFSASLGFLKGGLGRFLPDHPVYSIVVMNVIQYRRRAP